MYPVNPLKEQMSGKVCDYRDRSEGGVMLIAKTDGEKEKEKE